MLSERRRLEVKPCGEQKLTILVAERVLENLSHEEARELAKLLLAMAGKP